MEAGILLGLQGAMMAHYFCVSCPQVLPPSPKARGNVDVWVTCRHRRSIFWRCQDRQPHLGLFEIGPDHELYRLTCMMQEGLWTAIQASMEHPPIVSDHCSVLLVTERGGQQGP